jgi:hypothetical protein
MEVNKSEQEKDGALLVFTREGPEVFAERHVTSRLPINATRARQCKYIVFTACSNHAKSTIGLRHIPNYTGFMIALITDAKQCADDIHRGTVNFGQYWNINMPGLWPKGVRNPVRYTTLRELGIDILAILRREYHASLDNMARAQAKMIEKDPGEALVIHLAGDDNARCTLEEALSIVSQAEIDKKIKEDVLEYIEIDNIKYVQATAAYMEE